MTPKSIDKNCVELVFSVDEVRIINNSLNEALAGLELWEFQTRMGANPEQVGALLKAIGAVLDRVSFEGEQAKLGK